MDKTMDKKLKVLLLGRQVGTYAQDRHGEISFRYLPQYLAAEDAIPLSRSLPLNDKVYGTKACRPFFAGILPEEGVRESVAKVLGVSARNDFSLLREIGGECAGAVSLIPEDEVKPESGPEGYRPLPETELAAIIDALPVRPLLAGEDGVRLSLAGAQDKLPVYVANGLIHLPLGGEASSHILKPDNPRFPGLAFNEHFCLTLARKAGLRCIDSEIVRPGNRPCVLVRRYDRESDPSGSALARMHQEDFCQALGVVPERKYQNEGGPGLADCFRLVREAVSHPLQDITALLNAVLFNWLIGNNDAHGKNFSLLYGRSGRARLAPLYDLVCTGVYPELTPKMAMKLGGEPVGDAIRRHHFERFAEEAGLSKPLVIRRLKQLAGEVLGHLDETANETEARVAAFVEKRCLRAAEL